MTRVNGIVKKEDDMDDDKKQFVYFSIVTHPIPASLETTGSYGNRVSERPGFKYHCSHLVAMLLKLFKLLMT